MTQQKKYQKEAQKSKNNQQRRQKYEEKAKRRRQKKYQKMVKTESARAQAYLNVMKKAVSDLKLPILLEAILIHKLKAHRKLMDKIFGMMFPCCFGCRSYYELSRVRGWDKNLPSKILGALPKRKWLERFRKISQEILTIIGKYVQDKSEATKSRWQWTWIIDDSVFKKYGEQLGLVGKWWSGQSHGVEQGIDGLMLVIVVGDGKLIIPVDFEIRRPDPQGAGRPCYDKMTWAEIMMNRTWDAFKKQGIELPKPIVVADSWFGNDHLMMSVEGYQGGVLVVEGKTSYVFELEDGTEVKGQVFLNRKDWDWRRSPQTPGLRYARFIANNPTFGEVTITIVAPDDKDACYYLICWSTKISSTRLIRAYKKRYWIEWCFRVLKSLLDTDFYQSSREEAYYGHFTLRLIALTIIGYTARYLLKQKVTIEELIFSFKHYWRFLDSELLDNSTLSCTFLEDNA